MNILLFNTLSKLKENIILDINKIINIYVCGVTVYSNCHIGHARTFLVFDILVKYLKYLKYKVNYIRNITDIDDKIVNESLKKKVDYKLLTKKFIINMNNDFYKLNIDKPTYEPKVTNNIKEIIELIKILIDKKHVYKKFNGDLLFSIKSFNKYGKLSNRYINNLFKDNIKNKFSDFIVWKLNNEYPNWNSPWGKGRPGWHIECSSISKKFINNNIIDIHGGGIDLLFPHHENELAQSYSGFKNFKINIWMHIGSVIFLNKKMSKSLNNFLTIKYILNYFHPEVIRLFLTIKYYRKPIEYNIKNLKNSENMLNKLYKSIYNFKINKITDNKSEFTYRFNKAMSDDLDIYKAYSILLEMSNEINKFKKKNNTITNSLVCEIKKLGKILGILQSNPYKFLKIKKSNILK